jgi:hypothetical protein
MGRMSNTDSSALSHLEPSSKLFHKVPKSLVYTLLLIAFALGLTIAIYNAWPFTTDDAYITLRYAFNWANLGQLNWNLNDPVKVEGYSNSLYLGLAYLATKLSLNPILVLKVISLFSLVGALIIIYLITNLYANSICSILAVTFLGSYYGTIWWTVSGLETITFVFLTLISFYLYLLSTKADWKKSLLWLGISGFSVALTGITRIEGPVVGIAIVICLLLDELAKKISRKTVFIKLLVLAASFLLIYGTYFLLRFLWFKELLPNSYYCKKGFTGNPRVLINMFLVENKVYLLIGLIGFLNKKARTSLLAMYSYIILLLIGLYGTDPIIGQYNRHSLIAVALTGIILSLAIFQIWRIKPMVTAILVFFLIIYNIQTTYHHRERLTAESSSYGKRMEARAQLADYLNSLKISSYAMGDCGLVPYLTPGKKVFDYYGLNSKEFTSWPINRDSEAYVKWLATQSPEAVIVISNNGKSFSSRNKTQNLLFEIFNGRLGYADLNKTFGDSGSIYLAPFYYRILIKKGEKTSY